MSSSIRSWSSALLLRFLSIICSRISRVNAFSCAPATRRADANSDESSGRKSRLRTMPGSALAGSSVVVSSYCDWRAAHLGDGRFGGRVGAQPEKSGINLSSSVKTSFHL
jgi:hypothetical protein